MNRALLQQVLDALEGLFEFPDHLGGGGGVAVWRPGGSAPVCRAIKAIRTELAKPEPEPIAYLRFWARQSASPDGGVENDEGLEVCGRTEIGDDGLLAKPVYLKETK